MRVLDDTGRRHMARIAGMKSDRAILSKMIVALVFVLSFCSRGIAGGRAYTPPASCEGELMRASKVHGAPIGVLYAVGLTESGTRGSLHSFAVNIEGRAHYPSNMSDAIRLVEDAQRAGASLIDIGCMQINLHFHRRHFRSLEDVFEPSKNVDYGASYLKTLRVHGTDWTDAVGRYHASPRNHEAQRRYICAVVRNMVATGFGTWTDPARKLCGV